jgi:hypothetical protein
MGEPVTWEQVGMLIGFCAFIFFVGGIGYVMGQAKQDIFWKKYIKRIYLTKRGGK